MSRATDRSLTFEDRDGATVLYWSRALKVPQSTEILEEARSLARKQNWKILREDANLIEGDWNCVGLVVQTVQGEQRLLLGYLGLPGSGATPNSPPVAVRFTARFPEAQATQELEMTRQLLRSWQPWSPTP
jgi:hypothetical protein